MLNVKLINAFNDNYIFLLTCESTGEITVVDPGDADVVMSALGDRVLDKILLTHHHIDHVGGVERLCEVYNPSVIGYQGDAHRLPCVTEFVDDHDEVYVGDSEARVLFVPGHTSGHIAYFFEQEKMLFCGDTLFAGGCGRLFEGTPDDMFNSLVKFENLPDDTQVFCAHEYTVNNYRFAKSVNPTDEAVEQALAEAEHKRLHGQSTVPTFIGYEKAHNVFLRAKTVEEFAGLRQKKDDF